MRYGLLTVAYAVLVLLATQVFRFHTPVGLAASTLTAAVLFNLPRRRLQRAVNGGSTTWHYTADGCGIVKREALI
jgi:hypothetical protein